MLGWERELRICAPVQNHDLQAMLKASAIILFHLPPRTMGLEGSILITQVLCISKVVIYGLLMANTEFKKSSTVLRLILRKKPLPGPSLATLKAVLQRQLLIAIYFSVLPK